MNAATTLAAAAGLAIATTAHAQMDRTWTNPAGGNWNDTTNWSPMDAPNTPGENAIIDLAGIYTVSLTAAGTRSIDLLDLANPNAAIDISPSSALRVTALNNNGIIRINPTASAFDAVLTADADLTLTGTGTIELIGGFNDARLNTAPEVTMTNIATHTIRGAGELNAALINNGLVQATNVVFGTILELQGEDKINNATFAASPSATLQIDALTIDQTGGGTIDAQGGTVNFAVGQTSTIIGGTITDTVGTGTITRQNGTTTLQDVVIDTDIVLDASGILASTGSLFVNNGTIAINNTNSGFDAILRFDQSALATGTGTFLLGGGFNDSRINTEPGAVLTNDAGHTIEGAGELNAALINNGLVQATNVVFGTILELQGEDKINNATFAASPSATLQIDALTIDQTGGGTIDAQGGTVNFASGQTSTIIGGTITDTAGTGTVTRQNGTTTLQDVVIDTDIAVDPSGILALSGTTVTNNATLFVNDSSSGFNGIVNFPSTTALNGTGTIDLGGGVNDSQITVDEGEIATIGQGQTITGSGDLTGEFIFEGTLAPDGGFASASPIGRIDARGSGIAFTANTNLLIDVASSTSFDQINRPSNDAPIHLAGDLVITLAPGASAFTLGQELPIIEAGGPITGSFDTNNVSSIFINADLALRLVQRSDEVVLRVINFDCPADIIAPLDILDLSDVDNFILFFTQSDPVVDIAAPFGILDLTDIDLFIQLFTQGCF